MIKENMELIIPFEINIVPKQKHNKKIKEIWHLNTCSYNGEKQKCFASPSGHEEAKHDHQLLEWHYSRNTIHMLLFTHLSFATSQGIK